MDNLYYRTFTQFIMNQLNIMPFVPSKFGVEHNAFKDTEFLPDVYGTNVTDGTSRFQETLSQSMTAGYGTILFSNTLGLPITGFDLTSLCDDGRELADPDVLFSLYIEPNQEILNYFRTQYGVQWIESLRRRLIRQKEKDSPEFDALSGELAFGVSYNQETGLWHCLTSPMETVRHKSCHILIT